MTNSKNKEDNNVKSINKETVSYLCQPGEFPIADLTLNLVEEFDYAIVGVPIKKSDQTVIDPHVYIYLKIKTQEGTKVKFVAKYPIYEDWKQEHNTETARLMGAWLSNDSTPLIFPKEKIDLAMANLSKKPFKLFQGD